MADDAQPLLGDSAADPPATVPQVGTLDVDLMISKLLGYKNTPGKQVWDMMSARLRWLCSVLKQWNTATKNLQKLVSQARPLRG